MSTINPENHCAHLIDKEINVPLEELVDVRKMFDMQAKLQDFLADRGKGIDFSVASYIDKVKEISVQWKNLTTEFSELIERLPHKEWKTYSQEVLEGKTLPESHLETLFEYVDMFHFFMNIGLCLGIDGETFAKLYYLKNKENFERQDRGY